MDGVPEFFAELELAAEYHLPPDWFLTHPLIWRQWAILRMQVKGDVARQKADHLNNG